jgi:excisionase family DNA binding protein
VLQYHATIETIQTRREKIMPRDERWLSVSQAADVLGVSRFTIWRMQEDNRMPAWVRTFKPGAHRYYWREDIERLAREAHSENTTK